MNASFAVERVVAEFWTTGGMGAWPMVELSNLVEPSTKSKVSGFRASHYCFLLSLCSISISRQLRMGEDLMHGDGVLVDIGEYRRCP